jgi:hypothetical protein
MRAIMLFARRRVRHLHSPPARMAQWIAHNTSNVGVPGSNPGMGSRPGMVSNNIYIIDLTINK